MYIISAEIDKVYEEFPKVKKWVKVIDTKIKKEESKKIIVYYAYGFSLTKETKLIKTEEVYKLKYKKRLELELSKVRVDITIKSGNTIFTNRMSKIPQDIINIVNELTKVKMMVEGELHQNQSVIKSIPEVDTSIISYRIVRDDDYDEEYETGFNLDDILDKISIEGIESLSDDEKDFLNKSSEDLNGED